MIIGSSFNMKYSGFTTKERLVMILGVVLVEVVYSNLRSN
jgi:hypothetical protein